MSTDTYDWYNLPQVEPAAMKTAHLGLRFLSLDEPAVEHTANTKVLSLVCGTLTKPPLLEKQL